MPPTPKRSYGKTYLLLVGISPDGCSYFNGKYHQEEAKELEEKGLELGAGPASWPKQAEGILETRLLGTWHWGLEGAGGGSELPALGQGQKRGKAKGGKHQRPQSSISFFLTKQET